MEMESERISETSALQHADDVITQDRTKDIDDDDSTSSNLWKLKYICWFTMTFVLGISGNTRIKKKANFTAIMYSSKCYWLSFTSVAESWLKADSAINNAA
jgi:hypothetical protein